MDEGVTPSRTMVTNGILSHELNCAAGGAGKGVKASTQLQRGGAAVAPGGRTAP